MSAPRTLARPLAARIAALAEPTEYAADAPLVWEGVTAAAQAALESGQTHYTDRPGIEPLRARAVNWLSARYGVELDSGQVTITCGATEARFVAVKQLAAGKAILAPDGGRLLTGAAALVGVPILTTLHEPTAVSILYLTPADDPATADLLLAAASQYGWWVIFDTSVAGSRLTHPSLNADLAPTVISIGSYSYALPGWRVGWMAGSSAHNKLRGYKQSMTICTTSVSQWAALGLEAEA
jgi:aspartate/methionine/tyrosine aminotransferase